MILHFFVKLFYPSCIDPRYFPLDATGSVSNTSVTEYLNQVYIQEMDKRDE